MPQRVTWQEAETMAEAAAVQSVVFHLLMGRTAELCQMDAVGAWMLVKKFWIWVFPGRQLVAFFSEFATNHTRGHISLRGLSLKAAFRSFKGTPTLHQQH